MLEAIPSISTKNFKSIRDLQITGCSRVNLFIGKPNVGKSNILEALSTFSIPYLRENSTRKLSHLIRLENLNDLLENGRDELSVYMVDFRDGQSVVNRLTADRLHEIFQNGVDLFTNSESYL
jgi:AAA15 family ATPase/GTPase